MNIDIGGFLHSDMVGGFLDLVPSLYGKARADSALATATVATALRSSSLDPKRAPSQKTVTTNYAKALKSINQAFEQPDAWCSDSTLAAILMLGLYEVRCFLT